MESFCPEPPQNFNRRPKKSPHIETPIEFLTASPPMGLLLIKPAQVLLSYTGPNSHDAHRSP